ncbi:MAG: fibronectin type III domain-containing protein, partial [Candidatus Marinimicrobia bacterium]|nr:fibronectin type III domain-containing protein [Candidatus Neomarinimicrobiota bacterium]
LATANSGSNNVSVLLNNGNGTFTAKIDYAVGTGPFSVFSADLDGDGDLDLAVANFSSNNVSVLLNIDQSDTTPPAAPTGLVAVAGNQRVDLSWRANSEADFLRYRVYQSEDQTNWVKVDSTGASLPLDTTTTIANLTIGTTYYFHVTAVDAALNESVASNVESATPQGAGTAPTVTTGLAMNITSTAATLRGTVNPNGTITTATFEYGTTPGYGSSAAAGQSPVSGTGELAVSATISGLTPNTIYHYRVATTSLAGPINGGDIVFQTPADANVTIDNQVVTGTGQVTFTGTGVTMNFTSLTGTDTITVSDINSAPGGSPPSSVTMLLNRYWVIDRSGSGSFSLDITFDLGPGTISAADQAAPGNLRLLRRATGSADSWAEAAGATSATDSSTTFAGITGFSEFTIGKFEDIVGPAITGISATSSPSVNQPVTVTATITDASTFTATLRYALGSTASYSQAAMTNQGGDTFSGTIPGTAVTIAGLAYYLEAVDSLSNMSRTDTTSLRISFTAGTLTTGMAGSAYPSGIPRDKWRLISIPGDVIDKSVSSIIQSAMGVPSTDTTWKIFRFAGPGDSDYQPVTSFISGQSYFLKQVALSTVTFTLGAGSSADLSGLSVTLAPGEWYFLSSPFTFPVTVSADQGVFSGPFAYGGFGSGGQEGWSQGQVQTTFNPWGGYIVYNTSGQNQVLDIVPASLGKSGPLAKANEDQWKGWKVHFVVEGEKYFDAGNVIGRIQGASEGLDAYDHPEPPRMDEYLSLVMELPGFDSQSQSYTTDFRSIEEFNGVWDFVLVTKGESAPLSLRSSLEGDTPPKIILLDLLTRAEYDLTAGEQVPAITEYTERYPYHLKAIAGSADYVAGVVHETWTALPEKYVLSQNYPNPFNPETVIPFILPRPSRVALIIYNLIGQEVITLLNDWRDMGSHTITWNGRGRQGELLPTGIYFAVLRAGDTIRTRKMLLLK